MVKVREVKHSDEEVSEASDSQEQLEKGSGSSYDDELGYGSEEGEEEMMNGMNPFEDLAEEGEMDMLEDLYGEEGEADLYGDEEGELEQDLEQDQEMNTQENLGTFDLEDDGAESGENSVNEEIDYLAMGDAEFERSMKKKFALKEIMHADRINERLKEVKQSFYNRLESRKLIKKQGRIPFSEHMTIVNPEPIHLTEEAKKLQINNDIKREVAFYNSARENVQRAMTFCVQAKIPIERPRDFFAEMVKSDEQMRKIKSNLLKQQNKIAKFEEKKGRLENKKFHKAIKSFTQQKRHQEKRDNMTAINTLKDKIKSGDNVGDKEFNSIMLA